MSDAQPAPFIPDKARAKAYLFWAAVITVVFMAVYPTINWYTDTRAHRYQLYLPFELDIPLVPVFIWAYISMYALFLFVWVVLIVASTVLVHQHHLIDAITGLAVTMVLRRYIRPAA